MEICIHKQHIVQMINKRFIFFLRFLRYTDLFPLIFWINKGMSDWCFFTNRQKCPQEKRNKMSA